MSDPPHKGIRTALFLLLAVCMAVLPLFSANSNLSWSLVRVAPPGSETARILYNLGFEHLHPVGEGFELVASKTALESIRDAGLDARVLDSDYGRTVAERNDWATSLAAVGEFATGSMGGYFSPDEILAFVDSLREVVGDSVIGDTAVIGSSLLGRPIWMVEVSGSGGDGGQNTPEVFFNSLTHAREGMSGMCLLYFLRFLADNYASTDSVRWLVDNRRIFCVPLVNPDGYEINWNIYNNQKKFGFWRKNARENNGNQILEYPLDGVDLNRNFGYKWGIDNLGSSSDWSSDGFRGDSAFSEPESRAIRELVASRDFTIALNCHSYGNYLLKPWSYLAAETPDSATFNRLGALLTASNGYRNGNATTALGYTANGEFTDWEYGDTLGGQIIAWTAEIGELYLGFWPLATEIEPIAGKMLSMFFASARAAGFWPGLELEGTVGVTGHSRHQTIRFRVVNHGLKQAGRSFVVKPVAFRAGSKVIRSVLFDSTAALPAADSVVIEFPPEVYSMAVELVVEQDGLTVTSLPLSISRPATDISADLDRNGRTDIFDLLTLLRALKGGVPEGEDLWRYDLNEDGLLNIFDLLDLLQRLKNR
jgi:zinc carboxypeptidase